MDKISVPRAAVEALVDPTRLGYFDEARQQCSYCHRPFNSVRWNEPWTDTAIHSDDCPVRIIQEALAQPQPPAFTDTERDYLRAIVSNWIDEGFTVPPYDAEVYSIIEKLGMTQADFTQPYDITPPHETP